MGAFDYQSVLAALDANGDLSDEVKQTMRELIRKTARENGDSSLERGERVEFARNLLSKREQRTTIRSRLMARFQISKTQAYRDIQEALQLSQKRPINGTKPAETITTEEAIAEQ